LYGLLLFVFDEWRGVTMPPQVLAALIGAAGALVGVATGAFLTGWFQRQAWLREQSGRSNDERRRIFAEFMSTAREWRATTLHAEVKFLGASAVAKQRHADGGPAAARTLGLRSEIALVAGAETIRASIALVRAHGQLAIARAQHTAGAVPDQFVIACRRTELQFAKAARDELGIGSSDVDLEEIFGIPPAPSGQAAD
jgi:hypothetical protein